MCAAMKRVRAFIGPWCAAVLALSIGVSSYGCKDSASISDAPIAPLASLTITPGSLQPSFSTNTTSYTADVAATVTTVTVTAGPKDSTTTMTINGVNTGPGQPRIISLNQSGPTTDITIVLTGQTGNQSTYDIVVRKVDNNLSALTVTPGQLVPAFTPSTLAYGVDVASGVTSVSLSATKVDPNAVMSGAVTVGPGLTTGQATIPLNGPGTATEVSITVAVPNSDAKTYTITVHRAALSSNNNLSTLIVTPGSLSPAFDSNQLTYTVDVGSGITSVDVTATKADPDAVISGDVPNQGRATIPLDGPGTNKVVSVTVTAPNGNSKTYRITVNRAALSKDNNLSALSVTSGTLTPAFSAGTQAYTVDVATGVTAVTVTATKSDPNAVMSIGSVTVAAGTATGQATITLMGPGTTTSESITVTAPDGTPKTYTIGVNRAAPSTDNNLSKLTVSAGSLVPAFASGTPNYSVDVSAASDTITVSATKSDPNAVMSASGSVIAAAGIQEGQVTVPLGLGMSTPVAITITAQDGISTKVYTLTVNRPAR